MKTIFEENTRRELISRIQNLSPQATAVWGKMTLYQMLQHCTRWEEMMQSKENHKQVLIGRLFGKSALKKVLGDEKPLRRGTPTLPELVFKDKEGGIEKQKLAWIKNIEGYVHFSNPNFVHVFFCKMTEVQVGQMVYKHIDHHLRQFNG